MASKLKLFLAGLILLNSTNSALSNNIEGQWFLHKFGELRAYHGDFLNVCSGDGFRSCRSVQYLFNHNKGDSFFGDARLSIARILGSTINGEQSVNFDPPQYSIEVFISDLPDAPKGPITLSIDGEIFQLAAKDWQTGSPEGYNVAQSFSIINPILVEKLIQAMRKGNSLRILYYGYKETRFQLRGLTKALDAIEDRLANSPQ